MLETDPMEISSVLTSVSCTLDDQSGATHDEDAHPSWKPIPMEINSVLTSVSCTLDDQVLYGRMNEMANMVVSNLRLDPPMLQLASIWWKRSSMTPLATMMT